LAINVAVVILGTGLLLVVGAAVFDIPVPQDPVGFLAAFLLGTGSVFSLGLLAVAIARTSHSVGGLVLIAYLPIMILGGVYLPPQFLADILKRVGEFTPPGVQGLQDAWTGTGPQPLQLARERNLALIPGGCPMMHCEPVDLGHRFMRWILRITGGLPTEVATPPAGQ
jgi:ABC-2 type transport system permease protein